MVKQYSSDLDWPDTLLALLAAFSVSTASTYKLTGRQFWESPLSGVIMLTGFAGILAVVLLLLERRVPTRKKLPAEILFAAWLLVLGSVLPLTYLNTTNSFEAWPFAGLTAVSIGGLGLMLADFIKKLPIELWQYGLFAALAAPVLLALAATG